MDIMSIDDNCNDVSLHTRMLRNSTVLAQRYLHYICSVKLIELRVLSNNTGANRKH